MKVLVIGNGGREHALAWKAAQSPLVKNVYVAPGNAGTHREESLVNVDIAADDVEKLAEFALSEDIELTIVGPEVPLVAGITDYFESKNLKCFGPNKLGAQLEGSKAFSKDFLEKYKIPTASYQVFTEIDPAVEFVKAQNTYPTVIKADGLAAGKGVIIAEDESVAIETITDMLEGNSFGDAGSRVVIEEFMQGEEVSFICMVDGLSVVPMATSQDHKRRDNGDKGPNTGGMGAYSPAPIVDEALHQQIMNTVIVPTLEGLKSEGIHYRGFLYAGLMITPTGESKVVEFNCRFGDPETQPIMSRLKSDLVEHCLAAFDGTLSDQALVWDDRVALGVVLASNNYPVDVIKGDVISGLDCADNDDNVKVFHAGTAIDGDHVISNGGRVLCVSALGEDIVQAQAAAYKYSKEISWENCFYRTDIGYRAVDRYKL